jgi:hypothetical protein
MMKYLLITIIILFSQLSFSQNYKAKLDEMIELYNDEDAKYVAIANELITNKYGKIDNETKFYCEYFLGYDLIVKDEYKKALDKYKDLLVFCEQNTIDDSYGNIRKCKKDIKSRIKSLEIIIANLPTENNPPPETNNTISENSQNNVISETIKDEDNKTDNNENKTSNDLDSNFSNKDISNNNNKTVTLTVSGTGKTLEEAKTNALRSAIEQAFGAFISSKTEILNDNLINNELVSVANGNVKNYDVVSQVEIPGNGFGITIKANVSIDKLNSFAESKGIAIEFKGGLFAQNIKLQKLNEQNELTACINIYSVIHELLQNGLDYTVETEDPKLLRDDIFTIKFMVKAKPNANYINAKEYLNNSLQKLAMTPYEIETYQKLNKKIYNFKKYNLRNQLSVVTLENLVSDYGNYLGNFKINIDNNIFINGPDLGYSFHYDDNSIPYSSGLIESAYSRYGVFGPPNYRDFMDEIPEEKCKVPIEDNQFHQFIYEWEQQFEFSQIEKIQTISIASRGVRSKFKYGGFVIYNDGSKMIIAAPYKYPFSYRMVKNRQIFGSSVKTSENIFEGKINMELLKNDKSAFFDLIIKFNINNNTDWHIPTADELKLYVKEVYGNIEQKFMSEGVEALLSSSFRLNKWGDPNIIYWKTSRFFQEDININEKSKEFFQDGRPFNSIDAIDIIKGLHIGYPHSYDGAIFLLPLIKYVTIK